MAIKQLVKTFALFLGYEMPDSSGQSSNILDDMTDGADGFGDAIGSANSGLDDTKKKLKEIEGSLASFDKLNIITKPTDDSGSKDDSAGGGMTIDPRLLSALEKYNYQFDNIRMKATAISEQLLKWYDNIQKAITENVFEPLQKSWNKYGGSIEMNLKGMLDNITSLIAGHSEIWGRQWKPFFQSASDLFFSLGDTAAIILNKVTGFLLDVWNKGGKVLFENLIRLGTSIMNLATSINDNFLKPLIKGFSDTFGKTLSTLIGNAMKLLGNFLGSVSDLINWLSKSKTAVIILGTAFTTMFATIKIAKLADLINIMQGSHKILKSLGAVALENSSILRKLWMVFSDGKGKIGDNVSILRNFSNILKNTTVITKLQTVAETLSNKAKDLSTAAAARLTAGNVGLAAAESAAAGAASVLAAALNFISNHPLLIMFTALATVTGAVLAFTASQEKSTYKMEDYSKSVQQNLKDVQDLAEGMKNAKQAAEDRYSDSLGEIELVSNYVDKLKDLGGESGYVENIGLAEFYVGKINEKMPDTVKLTEDYRLEWQKTPGEIDAVIKKMKEKAYYEAYEQLYVESLKASIKATQKGVQAQDDLNEKKARLNKLEKENVGGNYSTKKAKEIKKLKADIDGLEKTVKKSDKTVKESNKNMQAYEDQMSSVGDTAEETASKMSKTYKGLTDSQNTAFAELGTQLTLNKRSLKDHADGVKEMSDDEVKNTQSATNSVIKEYAKKASKYGMTYDDMLSVLSQQGIKLSKEEKKLLKDSLENENKNLNKKKAAYEKNKKDILKILKESNFNMSEEEEKQYSKMLDALDKNGIKISTKKTSQYQTMLGILKDSNLKEYSEQWNQYTVLLGLLDEHGIKLNEKQSKQYKGLLDLLNEYKIDMNDETASMLYEAYKNYKSYGFKSGDAFINTLKSEMSRNGGVLQEALNTASAISKAIKSGDYRAFIQIVMPSVTDMLNQFTSKFNNFAASLGNFTLNFGHGYATGGFPDMGQMFVARESGPELVGRIGSRTAVANNDQITQGVGAGVYNAIYPLFQALTSALGTNQNITVQVKIDDDYVEKKVKKANEKSLLKTGKPIFNK